MCTLHYTQLHVPTTTYALRTEDHVSCISQSHAHDACEKGAGGSAGAVGLARPPAPVGLVWFCGVPVVRVAAVWWLRVRAGDVWRWDARGVAMSDPPRMHESASCGTRERACAAYIYLHPYHTLDM